MPIPAALIALVVLFAGCSCEEPRTIPREIYLVTSDYCEGHLLATVDAVPETVSIDLAVVDVGSVDLGPPPVLERSSCATVEIPRDLQLEEIINAMLQQVSQVVGELPELREDGGYGLVAGLYLDDTDCALGGTPPTYCAMSTAFGARADEVWRLPREVGRDAGPPEGAIPLYVLCPSDRAPCFVPEDCVDGEPDGATGVECVPEENEACRTDESCRPGWTCGEGGFCDDQDGTCKTPLDGGVETCVGNVCVGRASCTDTGCFQPDAGPECLRGTCHDDTGLHLAGTAGYDEDITYRRCRSLHAATFSGE